MPPLTHMDNLEHWHTSQDVFLFSFLFSRQSDGKPLISRRLPEGRIELPTKGL